MHSVAMVRNDVRFRVCIMVIANSFTSPPGGNKVDGFLQTSSFFASEWIFSKLISLFLIVIVFIHRYDQCAFTGEGFIAPGNQDVERSGGKFLK